MTDCQVMPWDLYHHEDKSRCKTPCAGPAHSKRPTLKIKDVCPDITPDLFCHNCNAETFVISAFVLAESGYQGPPSGQTISIRQLNHQAENFLHRGIQTTIETMMLVFAGEHWADEGVIRGCEQQAWKKLSKSAGFSKLASWIPETPTKAGESVLYRIA